MRQSLVALVAILPRLVPATEFINPPSDREVSDPSENAIYPVGHSLNITWDSDGEEDMMDIALWQYFEEQSRQESALIQQNQAGPSVIWPVKVKLNLTASNIFYLGLYPTGNDTGVAWSTYFNITKGPDDTAPTGRPDKNAPTGRPDEKAPTGGIGNEMKVVLGVGIALAGLNILILAWVLLQHRKLRTHPPIKHIDNEGEEQEVHAAGGNKTAPPMELGSERRTAPTELPTDP